MNIDTWISGSSGWRVHSILNHFINLTKYKPLNGSSYIELPLELRNPKKGLINIKNKDNECFRWCHIRKINPQDKYPERVKKVDREMVKKLDYSDISFPVSQKDYNKVERKNGIRVNIFGYENKQPYPIYVSKERFKEELNLLLIEEDGNKHYVLIKDFNSFMVKHSKHKGRKNFCMNCLQCFSTSELLNEHRKNCIVINGKQAINMPKVGENELKFNHHNKQIPVPFVIYADFEAITKKMHGCDISEESKGKKKDRSYMDAYQTHIDCGYGYKVVCHYNSKLSKATNVYRGEGAVYKFMEKMLEKVEYCKKMVKKHFNRNLTITKEELKTFKGSNECHICGEKYGEEDKPIMDYCKITGKFRDSAHGKCSSKLRIDPERIRIPVIFHNLHGYDSHFIMQQIGKIANEKSYVDKNGEIRNLKINAIPNNMERYMAFMLGNNLTFIDSFQFMSSSLDRLVSNLRMEDLKYTSKAFYGKKLELMSKKGLYPLWIVWKSSK